MSKNSPQYDPIPFETHIRDWQTGESRLREFHVGRLFHGTDAVLNPGDIIEPRGHKAAFATDNINDAKGWAKMRSQKSGQQAHVYDVEPIDQKPYRQTMKHSDGRLEYVAENGYRVRGRAWSQRPPKA